MNTPMPLHTKTHLVLTMTPVANPDGLTWVAGKLYVNGAAIAQSLGPVTPDTVDQVLTVGGWATYEAGLDGTLDDLQVYNRPLTPAEVSTLTRNPGIALTDVDGDGMLDGKEIASFGTTRQRPGDDYDGDGLTNASELHVTLTNPADSSSSFAITDLQVTPAGRTVTWKAGPGSLCTLEYNASGASTWIPVGTPVSTAADGTGTAFHAGLAGTKGFYRVKTIAPR